MNNIITIPNIKEFTMQVINGDLILTRINPVIDETTLFQKNLLGSTVIECKINNIDIYIYINIIKYLFIYIIL